MVHAVSCASYLGVYDGVRYTGLFTMRLPPHSVLAPDPQNLPHQFSQASLETAKESPKLALVRRNLPSKTEGDEGPERVP